MDTGSGGVFVNNLVHFGRLLRATGLSIGTGRILTAVRAVEKVGIASREDFYWTLHSVFVSHPRQRYIFDQAFEVFWQNPRILERSIATLLPEVRVARDSASSKEMARRLAEALYSQRICDDALDEHELETELKASLTYSDRERLQDIDFESMSGAEMAEAKLAVQTLKVAFKQTPTRRYRTHHAGDNLDMRRTLRDSLRGSADVISLVRRKRRTKQPPVVLLCDISGSMSEYSRMVLHFAHSLMLSRKQVSCFVFGTRLTNITRQLRIRDVDCALDEITQAVEDWYGGTRIGACLKEFNRKWVRRLPMHNATVLLVTDGLDRSESNELAPQIQLLHRSCKDLFWLNPLLRYQEFEPRVSGIRTILPHVDAFLPVHNLASLQELAKMLNQNSTGNETELRKNRLLWRDRMASTTPFVAHTPVVH